MGKQRPEYVHCVGFGLDDNTRETWCGHDHGFGEPFFIEPTHAALHGRNKGRLMVCPECRDAIIAALRNGYEAEDKTND